MHKSNTAQKSISGPNGIQKKLVLLTSIWYFCHVVRLVDKDSYSMWIEVHGNDRVDGNYFNVTSNVVGQRLNVMYTALTFHAKTFRPWTLLLRKTDQRRGDLILIFLKYVLCEFRSQFAMNEREKWKKYMVRCCWNSCFATSINSFSKLLPFHESDSLFLLLLIIIPQTGAGMNRRRLLKRPWSKKSEQLVRVESVYNLVCTGTDIKTSNPSEGVRKDIVSTSADRQPRERETAENNVFDVIPSVLSRRHHSFQIFNVERCNQLLPDHGTRSRQTS